VVLDADHVYWSERSAGVIRTVGKAGGTPVILVARQPEVGGLAVGGGHLYWTVASGEVRRMDLRHASRAWHVVQPPIEVVARGEPQPEEIVADDEGVYWLTASDVRAWRHGTPAVASLARAQGAREIAVDATHVYFGGDAGILRIAKSGGRESERVASPELHHFTGLAVDDRHVYWTETTADLSGQVVRRTKAGGPKEVIAQRSRIGGVQADGRGVYWRGSECTNGWIERAGRQGMPGA